MTFFRFIKRHKGLSSLIFLGFLFAIMFTAYGGLSNPTGAFKQIVFAVGSDIKKDRNNHTNFLLLGVGGSAHDGADLTDTVILASLDHTTNKVGMLSIPRDLYLKTDRSGPGRINAIYDIVKEDIGPARALDYLRTEVSKVLELDIHYYIKIDFDGFQQIVNALGGVDVQVAETIYDLDYPAPDMVGKELFYLPKGIQHLDGETALKYVRSRKSTSDFDRSRRQQQVIRAIQQKALSLKTLTSPSRIKRLYASVADNIATNISLREIISLAEAAEKVDRSSVTMKVLHDDPYREGGFLYTPLQELYYGMFVLLPLDNDYSIIANYARMVLYGDGVRPNDVRLQLLNGTKKTGLAGTTKEKLIPYGFSVPRYGNAKDRALLTTTVFVKDDSLNEATVAFLKKYFGATVKRRVPNYYLESPYASSANVIVELGEDFIIE